MCGRSNPLTEGGVQQASVTDPAWDTHTITSTNLEYHFWVSIEPHFSHIVLN